MADLLEILKRRSELITPAGKPTGIVPISPAERDALVAEVRDLRDLLTRAIPHIDPNDSDAAHQLLRDCEEATRG